MAMHVLAGEFKGRRIRSPKGLVEIAAFEAAPETAFAMLEPSRGLRVLDLFAGSGVMGLEAVSRRTS